MTDEEIMKEFTNVMLRIVETHVLVQSLVEDYAELIANKDRSKEDTVSQIKQRALEILRTYQE